MKLHSSFQPLARELRAGGYHLTQARRSGHFLILNADGKYIISLSSSPSDGKRAAMNARTQLRQLGVLT